MNYTIYINKDNQDRFEFEKNKSGLVNGLLDAHYAAVADNGAQPTSENAVAKNGIDKPAADEPKYTEPEATA